MWRDHRRFAIHVLRDLGLSKDIMEQRILAEVEAMSNTLSSMKGKEIEMQDVFDIGVGSVINQLLFGYRFDGDKLGEFRQLKSMMSCQMREFSHPLAFVLLAYPWLKNLPYFKGIWNKIFLYRDAFYSFFDRQIEAHQKDVDYDTTDSKDYVEAFLKEKKRREGNGDNESFSSFLTEKLREEMDREIGSGRLVTMSDRNNLPYTNAVINVCAPTLFYSFLKEIQRVANLLPMNLPHETLCPVQVGKWCVPAHTGVIAQISCVLYDDEVFPSPQTFDPTRFIDDSGRLKKVEELIPFSIGKRQCLGEGLARMELFLFTANLFNRFELSCVNARAPPSMKKSFGTTVQPCPYRCLVKPRYD
uniref:Unspecific monooxygenase n=1 Tax=Angiostrongylus cantonensis TaxID=6313 RepID=A0A0K0DIR2_ANGCA